MLPFAACAPPVVPCGGGVSRKRSGYIMSPPSPLSCSGGWRRGKDGPSLPRLTALLFSDNLAFRKMTVPSIKKEAPPNILKAGVALGDDTRRVADTRQKATGSWHTFPFLKLAGRTGPVTKLGLCASSCITHITSWSQG